MRFVLIGDLLAVWLEDAGGLGHGHLPLLGSQYNLAGGTEDVRHPLTRSAT